MLLAFYRGATPRHGALYRNGYATSPAVIAAAAKLRNFWREFPDPSRRGHGGLAPRRGGRKPPFRSDP